MSQSDPPDPPSESLLSRSDLPPEHKLEDLIVQFTRGIQACTDNSLAVKTLVESYLNHAIQIMREDLALAGGNQFRRIDDLTRAVAEINLGNQRALGAMQELIDIFRSDASLERGLVVRVREDVVQAQLDIKESAQQLSQAAREISGEHPIENRVTNEDDAPIWFRGLWQEFGDMGWKHKGRIIGVTSITVMVWLKAAPSVVDAIKLFLGGG